MKVFPPLVPIALSSADPGSLVIYEKSLAFVTSVAGQGTARTLAIFNGANRKFIHASALAVHELVLRVGGDVNVEPDLEFGTVELRSVSSEDTSTLFIRDRDAYGMLDMG